MKRAFQGWDKVAKVLRQRVDDTQHSTKPNEGQRKMLTALAARLSERGVIIADEVGMGKTLVAAEVARAVKESGGRVAILVPTGLRTQWQDELHDVNITTRGILNSMDSLWNGLQEASDSPRDTWMDDSIVLISHTFINWRFSGSTGFWRYTLLPVMLGQWRKQQEGRFPWGYFAQSQEHIACFEAVAARCVSMGMEDKDSCIARRFEDIADNISWSADIYDAKTYSTGSSYRRCLEQCVGLALGGFDLIIIDEAHKSRGEKSGLSRSLDSLLLRNKQCRIMGITATPVELGCEQWSGMLERIGADPATLEKALADSAAYIKAVIFLQTGAWRHYEYAVNEFIRAARTFKETLAPWVLRRSKAEDKDVQQYKQLAQTDITYSYHTSEEVLVSVESLDIPWQKAVCAAEALSLTSRGQDDYCTQRLRLTMGSGHGIAALLDTALMVDDDTEQAETVEEKKALTPVQEKRRARTIWWQQLLRQNFNRHDVLYEHPAIKAAVQRIEEITEKGEKVLVFGTYTRPLQALDDLLNARDMVRCFQKNIPMPLELIPQDLCPVVVVALKQCGVAVDVSEVQAWLKQQYAAQRHQRQTFIETLEHDLEMHIPKTSNKRVQMLFAAMKDDATLNQGISANALVARALEEVLGAKALGDVSPLEVAQAFEELMGHICSNDEGDTDHDGDLDLQEAHVLWRVIMERLRQEHGLPRGFFSRRLFGATAHASRRTAQLAFNRLHSRLRVLVAQSRVGREGLNLHKACRHVLLLHPEWNPGVVEQQMGRVDRVGCYWAELLQEYADHRTGEIPRIVLHCVIFKGTYDEHQWTVLNQRRLALRAQFYGEILPEQNKEDLTAHEKDVLCKIFANTPSFSP